MEGSDKTVYIVHTCLQQVSPKQAKVRLQTHVHVHTYVHIGKYTYVHLIIVKVLIQCDIRVVISYIHTFVCTCTHFSNEKYALL